jgi:hypothetical protein
MELSAFIELVISGGGAAIGAYYALKWFFERVGVSPRDKRIIAFVFTAALAGAASVLLMWLQTAWPITPQEWATILFRDMSTAIMVNQIWHAGWDLEH